MLLVALLLGLGACSNESDTGSRGTEPTTATVPDIRPNDSYADARRLVRAAGLRLLATDVALDGDGVTSDKPYRVISVSPTPGSVVAPGSAVHIEMAYRPTDECPDILVCYPPEADTD